MNLTKLLFLSFLLITQCSQTVTSTYPSACTNSNLIGTWTGSSGTIVFNSDCTMSNTANSAQKYWTNGGISSTATDPVSSDTLEVGYLQIDTAADSNGIYTVESHCGYAVDITANPDTLSIACPQTSNTADTRACFSPDCTLKTYSK